MLREPSRSDPVSADWGREVIRTVRRGVLSAGVGVRTVQGYGGQVVSHVRPAEVVIARGHPFPLGPMWNFGVRFNGTEVTVYSGVYYHAGICYEWADPVDGTPTVSGLSNNDVVCLLLSNPGTGVSMDINTSATLSDTEGWLVRALFKVAVSGTSARLKKWYGGGMELGAKGTA